MTFNTASYKEELNKFPEITYEEYQEITDLQVRKDIAKKNKVVQTDAYNRTMTFLKGDDRNKKETYTLSLRKSSNKKYLVIDGIRKQIKEIFCTPITQRELDFAEQFYNDQKAKGGNGYFNKQMWQEIIDKHNGFVPLTINAVADGTVLKIKEPVMTVTGPGELAAVYEPLFLRMFFESAVATDAHYIDQIIGQGRAVEFGKRSAPNEDYHLDALHGNMVGGSLKITSNDSGALVYPELLAGGTTAHRYFACYPTEDDAFINAIQKTDNIALLVDLIDSYRGIDKIIELKKKYRHTGKKIAMRLDSGDLSDQAIYALKKLKEAEMFDPQIDKIIIADVSSIAQIQEIEEKITQAGFDPKQFISYGLGGLLIAKNKTRDEVSAAYKLTWTQDGPTTKLAEGKQPIPGQPNIEIRESQRVIVQENEEIKGERLLNEVYNNGKINYSTDDLTAIKEAKSQVIKTFQYIDYPQIDSDETIKAKSQALKKLAAQHISTR